jgi:hypothetical protein
MLFEDKHNVTIFFVKIKVMNLHSHPCVQQRILNKFTRSRNIYVTWWLNRLWEVADPAEVIFRDMESWLWTNSQMKRGHVTCKFKIFKFTSCSRHNWLYFQFIPHPATIFSQIIRQFFFQILPAFSTKWFSSNNFSVISFEYKNIFCRNIDKCTTFHVWNKLCKENRYMLKNSNKIEKC